MSRRQQISRSLDLSLLRHAALACVLAAALVVGAPGAFADDLHPFLGQEAAIQQAGKPAWLRAGVRLTYESGDATIYDDPSKKGSGGIGIMQMDLVGLSTTKAVAHFRFLMKDPLASNLWSPPVSHGATSHPGRGGKWWINPKILPLAMKALQGQPALGWKAFEGPTQVAGKTIQGVGFSYDKGGVKVDYLYDKATGLLARYSSLTKINGGKMTATARFMGLRELKLPWRGGKAPAWLAGVSSFNMSGSQTMQLPGSPPISIPLQTSMRVLDRGADYIVLQRPSSNPATPGMLVSGGSGTGGVWLPPAALARLRTGQVLDQDPTTGARLIVKFMGAGPDGRNVITLLEQMPGMESYADYDPQTGAFVRGTLRTSTNHTTIRFTVRAQ